MALEKLDWFWHGRRERPVQSANGRLAMKKSIVVVSVAFLVAIASTGVDGLKCYSCNSHNDSRCGSLRELGVFEEDCSSAVIEDKTKLPIMCRKIVQTVDYNMGDMQSNTRIIRGCGWVDSNYTGRCYSRSGFGGRQVVCSCTTDKCNSSYNNTPSFTMILSLLTLFVTVYFSS